MKKTKNWRASWYDENGKRKYKYGFTSRKFAEIYETRQKVLIEKNFSYGIQYDHDITIREIVEKYLEKLELSVKKSYFLAEKHTILPIVDFFDRVGVFKYRQLSVNVMREYVSWRKNSITQKKRQPTDRTINRAIGSIKRAVKFAHDSDLVEKNLIESFKKIRVDETEEPRILSKEDVAIIEEIAKDTPIGKEIAVLVRTGMRIGELLALVANDINLEKNYIAIQSSNAKSRKTRYIPMTGKVREIIVEAVRIAKENNRVELFVNKNGTVKKYNNFLKHFLKVLDKAKAKGVDIEKVNIHTLRKSYISHMIMAGEDPAKVMKIVGHQTWDMMKHYLHLTPDYMGDVKELF